MSEEEFKKVNYLCIGSVHLQGNIKGIEFRELDENNQETGKSRCFKKTQYKNCYAGVMYCIKSTADRMMNATDWIGTLTDEKRRLEIVTASKAVDTEFASVTQRKKSEKDNTDILGCLDPIRKAYNKTNAQGRAAIMAQAILYIQTGSKMK